MFKTTFGGETVTIEKFTDDGDVILRCRDQYGYLSDLKEFANRHGQPSRRYTTGDRVLLAENFRGNIKIGCLEDTKESFHNLIKTIEHYGASKN